MRLLRFAVLLAITAAISILAAETKRIEEKAFGNMSDGTAVKQFTLRNSAGSTMKVITLGAIITEIQVPDRTGAFTNVVLGEQHG